MKRRSFLAALGTMALGSTALAQKDEAQKGVVEPSSTGAFVTSKLRVIAWNVACGQWCTPEQVASALEARKPDLVLTNETPKFNRGVAAPDWSQEIGDRLGLRYVYVGSVSSAHHRAPDWGDVTSRYGGKFKSIISRWPLSNTHDYTLEGTGWSPASAIRAQVRIGNADWAVYSLHIPGHREWEPSKHRGLAENVLAHEPLKNVIVGGDFNVRTESDVLKRLEKETGLTNAITERSIDHILYKSTETVSVLASGIERGPAGPARRGGLSDHPYAWVELSVDA